MKDSHLWRNLTIIADLSVLKSVPLFSKLANRELAAVRAAACRRHIERDDILFYEGDPGNVLYVLLEGKIRIALLDNEGRQVILGTIKSGEFFGEMALFDPKTKRSASAIAVSSCQLLELRGPDFLEVLHHHPNISISVIRAMGNRLRKANRRIGNLIFLDSYHRVARYLLDLRDEGRNLADGSILLRRPKQADVAATVGVTRETVSRILHELHNQGLITMTRTHIIIRTSATSLQG